MDIKRQIGRPGAAGADLYNRTQLALWPPKACSNLSPRLRLSARRPRLWEEAMPRFYFDMYEDGEAKVDREGRDFSDAQEAQRRAMTTLTVASSFVPADGQLHAYVVRMRDESEKVVFESSVAVTAHWAE
jgi:hypothetical protein